MADTFIGIMRDVEAALGVATMSHEYEIIACFFDRDALTPNELARLSSCSNSGFYNVLKRLEGRKVICSETHPSDRRSRIYKLSAKTKDYIQRERLNYGFSTNEEWRRTSGKINPLRGYSAGIHTAIGISHLTCEYQILLNLYYRNGITNMGFTDIVDASLTKFNRRLRDVCDMGLVYPQRDPTDRRVKRYYATDATMDVIEHAYRRLFTWSQDKSLLASNQDN